MNEAGKKDPIPGRPLTGTDRGLLMREKAERGGNMGYTTEFIGKFVFNRKPTEELREYINRFSKTRHVKRDVKEIKRIFPDWKKRSWKQKRRIICD